MSSEENRAGQSDLIRKLRERLGGEILFQMEGPGVYYMADNECGEFYIVEQTSPIISDAAKSYGKQRPDYAGLFFYSLEDVRSGSKIVDYELEKYSMKNYLPDHDSESLHAAAAYGAEDHPEYFGAYPAPIYTPWGHMTRYQRIGNGIFWMETDQCDEVLSICYPIWNTILSEEAVSLGATMERDWENGIDDSLGGIFFRKPDACIPIFEIMRMLPKLRETGRIAVPALMNAIWKNHPDYVLYHNMREQSGANDMLGLLLRNLGLEITPNVSVDNMIFLFPDAGMEYIQF